MKVLKGAVQTGRNKSLLRNVLVVTQFSSAIFLIVATLFAVKQLNFMESKDPGFNKDQILTLSLNRITFRKYDVLKQDLLQSALISVISINPASCSSEQDPGAILPEHV